MRTVELYCKSCSKKLMKIIDYDTNYKTDIAAACPNCKVIRGIWIDSPEEVGQQIEL